MEQRLKKQRNHLFLRVGLILLTVWFVVSAAYCTIYLHSEKNNIQNRELANFSHIQRQLSTSYVSPDYLTSNLLVNTNLNYIDGYVEPSWESQYIVTNLDNHKTVADTAKKISVNFGIKIGLESSGTSDGFLDYNTVRNALSNAQYQTIAKWLNTSHSDGKHYELICTQFHIQNYEFIPVEMKIALTENENTWFASDEIIETFKLNTIPSEEIYQCNDMHRNIISKDFLLDGAYNRDIISTLSKKHRAWEVDLIASAPLEYIFYASDFLNLSDLSVYDNDTLGTDTNLYVAANNNSYFIQYAKKIHLLDTCQTELVIGVSVIFAFFLTIAIILCLMIWRTVKIQILIEHKRTELTNALAHDIKTPLFIISGYAQNLKANINNEKKEHYADRIISKSSEANALVHKMLNFSKLDSAQLTLNRSDFNLSDLVQKLLKNYAVLPDNKKITFEYSSSYMINADCELIKTALQNLIDNAVKYSLPKSEIKIEITGKYLRISNECENLAQSDLKQIWQPYARKDKSRRQNGSGLGLSIVKSILDLHGLKYACKINNKNFEITIWFRAI